MGLTQELVHEGASLSFTTRYQASRITIDLNERARGRAASFGLVYEGKVGTHQIRMEWSSPRPTKAKLIVRHCRNADGIDTLDSYRRKLWKSSRSGTISLFLN